MRLEGLLTPTTEHPERQVGSGFEWQQTGATQDSQQEGLQVRVKWLSQPEAVGGCGRGMPHSIRSAAHHFSCEVCLLLALVTVPYPVPVSLTLRPLLPVLVPLSNSMYLSKAKTQLPVVWSLYALCLAKASGTLKYKLAQCNAI